MLPACDRGFRITPHAGPVVLRCCRENLFMKNVWCFTFAFMLNLLTAQTAFAESFSDKFKSWLLGSEANAATLEDSDPGMDRIARGCSQCHDGGRAAHIAVKNADAPLQFSSLGVQVNHPVGMDYDVYAARKMRSYKQRLSLDSNITLVDGKVTCISCHRIKETEVSDALIEARRQDNGSVQSISNSCSASNELTVGPRQSDLCLACHNL